MKYYWVNQGSTWKTERTDGFLWAPLLNKKGKEMIDWQIDSWRKFPIKRKIYLR